MIIARKAYRTLVDILLLRRHQWLINGAVLEPPSVRWLRRHRLMSFPTAVMFGWASWLETDPLRCAVFYPLVPITVFVFFKCMTYLRGYRMRDTLDTTGAQVIDFTRLSSIRGYVGLGS